ncbi:MAG: outer membrane beta-barrel protein [Prevotella sp.]|nr:outer membrane beta-barrel protein [Prevotella sp.]
MKHNDWTEQLRQRLNDAEVPAPENLWDSISQQLDAQGQQQDAEDAQVAKKPHRVALLPWAAAASVVLIAGVGMWWQLRSNTPHIAMLEPTPHPISLTDNKAVVADASATNTKPSAINTKASAANTHISTTSTHAMLAYKDSALAPTASNKEEVMALAMAEQEVQSEPIAEVSNSQGSARTLTARNTYALPRTQHQTSNTRWQMGVGTAGNMNRYESSGPIYVNSLSAVNTEYADNEMFRVSPYEQDTKDVTHHDMPISIGFTASYSVTPRIALASGLVYTLATSSFQHGASMPKETQTLHYVGIPLNLNYTIWGNSWLRTYVMAGAQADMNVKATLKADGHKSDIDNDRAQFSVTGGAGVQLNVAQQLGVYVEPGVRYYFDNGSAVQTIFKEHPTNFSLQVGLRWNIE